MLDVCMVFSCLLSILAVNFSGLFGAVVVFMSMYSRRMHVFMMGDSSIVLIYFGDCEFDGLMKGPHCSA